MPLYEYECEACGERFEVIRKFSDAPLTECARCGKGPVQKLLSSPAIQFKGDGWYVTDYARKGKGEGKGKGEAGRSEGGAGGGGGAAKKSDGAGTSGESKPAASSSDTPKAGNGGKAASAKSD